MKFSTVLSAAITVASIAAPVSATGLFDFCDLSTTFKKDHYGSVDVVVCKPPKVVTCGSTDTQKRDVVEVDNTVEEEKRTFLLIPAAACAVSEVIKLKEDLFECVINFELSKWNFIFNLLGNIVSKFYFSGCGVGDGIFTLISGKIIKVKKWSQWSTSIVVKPQRINGKCCLPKDLKLNIEFGGSGTFFSAFTNIFKKSFSWSFAPVNGNFVDFDCYNDFFGSLSARDQEEVAALEAATGKRGAEALSPKFQKRFLSFTSSLSVFKSISVSGTTFKNFCWDCDC
ncbi:CIC11C00000000748 [Sungouiella intermedia]|uniref:CIC11C00000000748 n=1 Tax=Sungouiella intermedia TaxID=45354 RepID=A0A1L0BFF6_9ASCO|nr:CIC11C00000000748 [[Candida] intermedia]